MGGIVGGIETVAVPALPMPERFFRIAGINILCYDTVFVKGEQYIIYVAFVAILIVVTNVDNREPFTRNYRIRCRDTGLSTSFEHAINIEPQVRMAANINDRFFFIYV